MATIFDTPLTGYRLVDTQYGDTLQGIAYRELGDASQWPLLISYNKLVYPFITDDPTKAGPGVILTGQQILVPAPVPAISSAVDPEAVFEIDVALDPSGNLQADSGGDFAVVSGTPNLNQALSNRIVTDIGELIRHSKYGAYIRLLIGSINGPNAALLAAKYAASAVLTDPRVLAVTEEVAIISGNQISVEMQVTPIVGRPVKLTTTL